MGGALSPLIAWHEAIANPGFGENVLRMSGVSFNFLAQLPDKNTQVFGLFSVVAAPDGSQQRAMRDDFTVMLKEVNKQIKFFRRKVNLLLAHKQRVGGQINHEITFA